MDISGSHARFETHFCCKPNPEKWCDNVTKSSHLYQVPGKSSHFWKYLNKLFVKPGRIPSNLKCYQMWRKCDVSSFRHCPSLKPRSRSWENSVLERPSGSCKLDFSDHIMSRRSFPVVYKGIHIYIQDTIHVNACKCTWQIQTWTYVSVHVCCFATKKTNNLNIRF